MCRDNDNQFFKVKFFFRYHYSCRTITNTSNVVFVQGAAGAFRSVWKVGSRWSSVDRLFEPHVSLTWLLRRRPERGNFRVSFPRTNAERYPTTLSLSAAFVFHFISLSLSFQFHLAEFLTRSFRRETSYETVLSYWIYVCWLTPRDLPTIFISLSLSSSRSSL